MCAYTVRSTAVDLGPSDHAPAKSKASNEQRSNILDLVFHAAGGRTVRLLLSEKSFLLTHCPQIYIRKEISRPGFLDVIVSRYSFRNSIDLRRVFFALRKYFDV